MLIALGLTAVVVVYNNIINRWDRFHGIAYVPVNLAFAATIVAVAAPAFSLSAAELGLQGDAGDLLLPLVLIALVAVGGFGLAWSRHAQRIADKRVAGMHGATLAWHVVVRIPFGTAITEELIFRGVLFAAWRAAGTNVIVAALCSSVAFGLWHISPTIIGVRLNDPDASPNKLRTAVVGAVLFTAVAGLGLTSLRLDTDGLLGPIVLHAGVNSMGALAAAAALSSTRNRSQTNFSP